jgi:hypothetical protein
MLLAGNPLVIRLGRFAINLIALRVVHALLHLIS